MGNYGHAIINSSFVNKVRVAHATTTQIFNRWLQANWTLSEIQNKLI
jgi:hypothetical protein